MVVIDCGSADDSQKAADWRAAKRVAHNGLQSKPFVVLRSKGEEYDS
jgi:hypothetical protein